LSQDSKRFRGSVVEPQGKEAALLVPRVAKPERAGLRKSEIRNPKWNGTFSPSARNRSAPRAHHGLVLPAAVEADIGLEFVGPVPDQASVASCRQAGGAARPGLRAASTRGQPTAAGRASKRPVTWFRS
jgi:hypothetical protein